MDAKTVIDQLYQQAALRRRSLEEGVKINIQSKTRIAYRKGAAEGVELVIKSLGLWGSYEDWRAKQCKKI